jgi:shikimate kinase
MADRDNSDSAAGPNAYPIVVLTGFMGSGKTSTGRALAELLGWAFVDLEEEIERRENVPIRELFRDRGEAEFREAERSILRACLESKPKPTVLALGGGAFLEAENLALLRKSLARTVFLNTPVEEMLRRCELDKQCAAQNLRPLASDGTAFRALYQRRLPGYRVAEVTIETQGKDLSQIADEIVRKLRLDVNH